jgi:hypothetical protein
MAMVTITPAAIPVPDEVIAKVASERAALRTRHGVRSVAGAEEGDVLKYAAGGICGFTYAPQTLDSGLFAKNPYLSFEMHKLADNSIKLIVCVTTAMKQKIESAADLAEIEFFPDAYAYAHDLIVLPYEKLSHIKPPSRDEGNKVKAFYKP